MQESTDKRKKIQVEGLFFTLFPDLENNKLFVVPSWIEVPLDTTFDDIELISPLKNPIVRHEDKPKTNDISEEVPSSTGIGVYTVRRINNRWDCSCPQNAYRRAECKHIKQVMGRYL